MWGYSFRRVFVWIFFSICLIGVGKYFFRGLILFGYTGLEGSGFTLFIPPRNSWGGGGYIGTRLSFLFGWLIDDGGYIFRRGLMFCLFGWLNNGG